MKSKCLLLPTFLLVLMVGVQYVNTQSGFNVNMDIDIVTGNFMVGT